MQADSLVVIPSTLSDEDLVTAVVRLATLTRETTASLVAHLAEMDARRLHLGAGCPSLFVYCTDVLRLSGHAAYHRIEAARLARRFPVILQMLADGALNLTTARLLGPHLTAANHDTLLSAAAGKHKREVQVLLAKAFPQPDVPSSIRKVPRARAFVVLPAAPTVPSCSSAAVPCDAAPTGSFAAPVVDADTAAVPSPETESRAVDGLCLTSPLSSPPARPKSHIVRPLAADRYEVRFTISATGREKLQLATDLLRHAVPDGDTGAVVERALTVLVETLAKKKFAAAGQPRPGQSEQARPAAPGTRHVPARVKRAVWLRDAGRCGFVGEENRRCPESGFLEFHHVRPYGAGGEATVENIELRCRAHNAYESEWFYGRRFTHIEQETSGELGPDRVDVPLGPGSP